MLTQEKIKELLHYDPLTGDVTRLTGCSNQVRIGDKVRAKSKFGHLQITIDRVKYPLHRIIWLYVHGSFP